MGKILNNWKAESFWLHTVFILVFYGLLNVALFAVFVLIIGQWLSRLVSGEGVQPLQQWLSSLSIYINQLLRFITFQHQEKPFPFSDWPAVADKEDSAISS